MEEFDEIKQRLIYLQNLSRSINITNIRKQDDKNIKFVQQLNSLNKSKFEGNLKENNFDLKLHEDVKEGTVIVVKGKKLGEYRLSKTEVKLFDTEKCFGCNNYLVSGLNCKIRVKYDKKSKKDKRSERYMDIGCDMCGVHTEMRGVLLAKGDRAVRSADASMHTRSSSSLSSNAYLPNTLPKMATAAVAAPAHEKGKDGGKKRRRAKGKAAGLGALLAAKRSQQEPAGSIGALFGQL